jgi:hypothetical protein
MGYYMRYFVTDEQPITLDLLESALRECDADYSISDRGREQCGVGVLKHAGEAYGEVALNSPGDGLFEDELKEFREFVEGAPSEQKEQVNAIFDKATLLIAVKVLFLERETETTLLRIDPIWDWLFANREGILQVDGEGFYDRDELILELK